ncbi:hypothetical protein BDV32DRAFT_83209 [Aspergillus pseudonomiae]|nr:hypothetical protein BDV32DRAFT_83209 [Aspergillus pseudonomiae]
MPRFPRSLFSPLNHSATSVALALYALVEVTQSLAVHSNVALITSSTRRIVEVGEGAKDLARLLKLPNRLIYATPC